MTGFFPIADAAAIGFGAFCGALCRYKAGQLAAEKIAKNPDKFGPWTGWHTAGINMIGSFTLGGISQSPTPNVLTPRQKLMLGVGFCGSFTTFSTYSCDVVHWIQAGQTTTAMRYVLANNVGSVGAAALGMVVVKKLFGK